MDWLDTLKLQHEWGADEALLDAPQDRRHAPAHTAPGSAPGSTPAPHPLPRPVRPPASVASLATAQDAAQLAQACTSLAELEDALRKFEGCALKHTATQMVFADGAADAKLIIIGEAPGGEEDRIGKPFVGPAGLLLNKMLGAIGLAREEVRIINAVPWRPPGNRTPTEAEIALCLPFLHRHIALIAPRGLMTLGAVASKAILGAQAQPGIRRLRGQFLHAPIEGLASPLPCLPSYHPAYLLRTPLAKKEAWADLLTLRAWLEQIAPPLGHDV